MKWKEDYLVHIGQMTNEEVLDEYTSLSGGDDLYLMVRENGDTFYGNYIKKVYNKEKRSPVVL